MSTPIYTSKQELIETIQRLYLLFADEFSEISDSDKDKLVDGVDRTPAQMIAYQLGWMNLLMGWDRNERAGEVVIMPAPGYQWNQLGALNASFYDKYADLSLMQLQSLFRETEQRWLNWIETLSEEELFVQGMRKWTGIKPGWAMVKWIQINSVAPFKSFRTKIRKWKKAHFNEMGAKGGYVNEPG